LALPTLEQVPVVVDVAEAAVVQLFVERVQQAVPTFSLTQHNVAAVAAICRRLPVLCRAR
jgi:predicted ATPase